MFQLKFNDNFTTINRDIPYWKREEDIPENIKKFIIDTSNNRVIYEESTNKFYCGKCTEELDKNNYCKKCDIKHKQYTKDDILEHDIDIKIIDKKMASKRYDLDATCYYFVFEIVDNETYLYSLTEEITYYNPLSLLPYKSSKIYINTTSSYHIEKEGVTNLETKIFTSFKDLDTYSENINWEEENIENSNLYKVYEDLQLTVCNGYIYTDNLMDLKNTIYKYSRIWELSSYLKEEHIFNISQLIMNPLYYKAFEYLMNYKLYNLAWNVPNWFTSGKNFKEIFGVDKRFLPFMSENNISYKELKILQFYPTTDIELLKYFSRYYWNINILENTNVDLILVKKCLEKNNLSSHYISEYFDYISMAKELKLDVKDKNILYPNNFREAHDELYNQIEVINDPIIDEKIKSLSVVLSLNKYEDETYVIYPASSIQDLVEESRQQKNCVRTYCEMVSNNESQIYFMRKKSELDKSLVTIEVRDKHIIQARVKYNKLPNNELNKILNKWEKTLIPITNN